MNRREFIGGAAATFAAGCVGMRMRYSDRDEFDIQAVQMDSQRR